MGLVFVRSTVSVPASTDRSALASSVAWQLALLFAAIGGTAGLAVGNVRRFVATHLSGGVRPRYTQGDSRDCCDSRPPVPAVPRTAQFVIFGIGLVVIFLLCITSPPAIDSRTLEECIFMSNKANRGFAEPIRSANAVWQPSGVGAIAFSSDGKYLATGSSAGIIGIWSTIDWTRAGQIEQEGQVEKLAFSPDGEWLYVAGGNGRENPILCRFRWRTGERETVFAGHAGPVPNSMALSTDGTTLVTSSSLRDELRIFNTTSGKCVHSFTCRSPKFVYAPRRNLILELGSLRPGLLGGVPGRRGSPGVLHAIQANGCRFQSR